MAASTPEPANSVSVNGGETMIIDDKSMRTAALSFWEKRRLWFNLALVPPGALAYFVSTTLYLGAGDQQRMDMAGVAMAFLAAAFGANLCFTFCYSLEFLLGSCDPNSAWNRYGRYLAFIGGTLLAMYLAFRAGHQIAMLQYGATVP